MTAFCQSSTSRSHPLAFMVLAASGTDNVENIPEPVQSSLLVDTPEDEPADRQPNHDPGSSPQPDAKHPSDQERAP